MLEQFRQMTMWSTMNDTLCIAKRLLLRQLRLSAMLLLVLALLVSRVHTACNRTAGRWVQRATSVGWGNLTCALEMSKYACAYQRKPHAAEIARWAFEPECGWLAPAAMLARLRFRRLRFLGDSLARQQFISLACYTSDYVAGSEFIVLHCYFYLFYLLTFLHRPPPPSSIFYCFPLNLI